MAQISLSLNGAFWPTSLPLFHGWRCVEGVDAFGLSDGWWLALQARHDIEVAVAPAAMTSVKGAPSDANCANVSRAPSSTR
jgi:hypothetical protein